MKLCCKIINRLDSISSHAETTVYRTAEMNQNKNDSNTNSFNIHICP
ncbi:hypothetical protein T08_7853 [Trichinella sp. T8]|nr:hypothetical protein T08_7853 [Trichinella sp. T8]